ncbi:MAG: DUF86 domain-containing protein [Phycisphaerales bacterium]|nr:DUF86 domain-containing protein [Phycisphaerales bacterium]
MRSDKLYLNDIVESSAEVGEFVSGVTEEEFLSSSLIHSAVLQKLIVMGEAASRVSPQLRSTHADVPWADVRAFRNFAVHAYFSVDWRMVWTTATVDVPRLRGRIEQIIRAIPESSVADEYRPRIQEPEQSRGESEST